MVSAGDKMSIAAARRRILKVDMEEDLPVSSIQRREKVLDDAPGIITYRVAPPPALPKISPKSLHKTARKSFARNSRGGEPAR